MSNYLLVKPAENFNPSAGNLLPFVPYFKFSLPLAHQLVNQLYYFFQDAFPFIHTQHPIVVQFIIGLFAIIKSNSIILLVLLAIIHLTIMSWSTVSNIPSTIASCPLSRFCSPVCVHAYTLQSILLIFCTRYLSKLLVGSSFHLLSL